MVNARENAMKKKDINAVMAQFSDDATFINGEGYYLANKVEIAAFHKGLI
jgi:ketosteroid isomerase-like protein